MITYPTIFFGIGTGPLKEDFEEYSVGSLPIYDQVWQYNAHQWLVPKNPSKYVGFTWKDRGVSGANDDFESWSVGSVSLNSGYTPYKGLGNFDIRTWSGLSVGFYRDAQGLFTSSDQLRGYDYINFEWGNNPPISGYKVNYWSAKFVAKLTLPLDGTYQLYVDRDEAARVFVGREDGPNNMIFNGWGTTPPGVKEACTPITYSAGLIDILVDFYEDADPSKLKLYWSMPTVSGGGPSTPIVLISPKYFGNSGFIGSFCIEGPYDEKAKGTLSIQGAYVSSKITLDRFREDYTRHDLSLSGHYSIGVIYNDKQTEYVNGRINYAGYYSPRSISEYFSENSNTKINTQGFYSYRSVHAYTSESTKNKIDSAGFYVYESAITYGQDVGKSQIGFDYGNYFYKTANFSQPENILANIDAAGFYVIATVPVELDDASINSISSDGYYKSLYAPYNDRDFGINYNNLNGIYFASRVNQYQSDYSINQIITSGHYVRGYVPSSIQSDEGCKLIYLEGDYYTRYPAVKEDEPSYNFINEVGFYISSTAKDYEKEPSQTNLNLQGSSIYRFVSGAGSDSISGLQNFDGNYLYRFSSTDILIDMGNSFYDLRGIYSDRYMKIREGEPAKDELQLNGTYYSRYGIFDFSEQAKSSIEFDALYYYGRAPNYESDLGCNLLNFNGDVKYRFMSNISDEIGCNILGLSDGNYFYGRVPRYYQELSCNLLQLVGDYSRGSWVSQDSAAMKFDFQSEFIPYVPKMSTLSYWVESQQASFYNMKKTLIYFGI